MRGTLIASTPRADLHLLTVQGIAVAECYAQITDTVRSRLGDAGVLLFAEPEFDVERGVIDWYTPVRGTPVPLEDLAPDKRSAATDRFAAMAGDIRALADPLRATGDSRRVLAAAVLELALRYPDEHALYLVGEQPVVVGWGCGPAQAGVEPRDLSRPGWAALRPEIEQTGPREPAGPVVRDRACLLPWLLALVLLLAALAAGYGLYSGRLPEALRARGLTPAPEAAPADADARRARLEELRAQAGEVRRELGQRRAQCGALALPDPAGPATPQDDMGFLAGEWVCDTGLIDTQEQPVSVIYAFAADGTGRIRIRGSEGECVAGARATREADGTLRIETDPEIPCPGGRAYRGQTIACTGSGAQTRCEGRNMSGAATWAAPFYRR